MLIYTEEKIKLYNTCANLKNAQRESCELSFIWGKMRIIARETVFQIALRNCSKEVGGGGQYICDFGEGGVRTIKHIFFPESFC